MDNLVKQRLLGALILIALAVVFWPIIFVTNGDVGSDVSVPVPPAPPVDMTPLPEPDNAGLRRGQRAVAQGQQVPDVLLPDAGTERVPGDEGSDRAEPAGLAPRATVLPVPGLAEARETLASPAMDADGLPIAYSLQVATMSDRGGAEKLRDDLVAGGYKAYLKRLRRDDKVFFRVLVGPRYSSDELLPVKNTVDDTYRVESLIIRYLP
ncbi:MAG: DedD protein [Halieaceae bacterium]|jgi:DedD protein